MFELAILLLKNESCSTRPYCADIVRGLFDTSPTFFLVTLFVISFSFLLSHSPENPFRRIGGSVPPYWK